MAAGGITTWRHYIYAGKEPVAVYSRTSTLVNTWNYFFTDHQGSIAGIANSSGAIDVNESFTAFGARRNPTTWSGAPSSGDLNTIASLSRQGYTFQTALGQSMGLNHMNGRVQDAITGRFLSADPNIPNPLSTQDYNRYSYVDNNPLSFLDPTGFDDETLSQVNVDAPMYTGDDTLPQILVTAAYANQTLQFQNQAEARSINPVTASIEVRDAGAQGNKQPQPRNFACPRFSSLDPLIQQDVNEYNSDNGFSPQDVEYLDPSLVEAMVAVESGGNAEAYASDPMQVNNAGDWDPMKGTLAGLTQGQAPGPALGIQAGITWLTYKAYIYNSAGTPVGFRGWPSAVSRYNGGGDPNYLSKVQAAQSAIASGCSQ